MKRQMWTSCTYFCAYVPTICKCDHVSSLFTSLNTFLKACLHSHNLANLSRSFCVFIYFLAVVFSTCLLAVIICLIIFSAFYLFYSYLQHLSAAAAMTLSSHENHLSFIKFNQTKYAESTADRVAGPLNSHNAHLSSTLPLIRDREIKSFLPSWPL